MSVAVAVAVRLRAIAIDSLSPLSLSILISRGGLVLTDLDADKIVDAAFWWRLSGSAVGTSKFGIVRFLLVHHQYMYRRQ